MSKLRDFTLKTSGAETSNGTGSAVDTLESSSGYAGISGEKVRIMLSISVITDSSALDLKIEGKLPGGAFVEVGSFPQLSNVTGTSILIDTCSQTIRAKWFVRGTISPSVTFEVIALRMV